jgi:hypothetical protein
MRPNGFKANVSKARAPPISRERGLSRLHSIVVILHAYVALERPANSLNFHFNIYR